MTDGVPTDPDQALRLLLAGNRRFVLGQREHPNQDADRRRAVAPGQRPFAVLFGCSDSRLAAEIIFDRGLGDLFVVRTAGHVVGPEVLGSIEYGIAILDVPLVAVLGHDSCGGVAAALKVARDGEMPPGAIGSVVEHVLPSVFGRWRRRDGSGRCGRGTRPSHGRVAGQRIGDNRPAGSRWPLCRRWNVVSAGRRERSHDRAARTAAGGRPTVSRRQP